MSRIRMLPALEQKRMRINETNLSVEFSNGSLLELKDLKRGYGVNHKQHGYIQYRGLATKHPYTDEPKVPHRYIFWSPVDEDG